MDTQRLILFIIFSFSLLFLWEAWQRHANPPPPVPPKQAQSTPAVPAKPADVPSAASTSAPAAGAGPAPTAAAPAAQGELVTIRTDLYTAVVDAVGGVISQVALVKHRDAKDPNKAYLVLQRDAERTSVAQAGLLGEGLPNHRTVYQVLPGPRELAPAPTRSSSSSPRVRRTATRSSRRSRSIAQATSSTSRSK